LREGLRPRSIVLHLPNSASKGNNVARTVPLNPALHQALADLRAKRGEEATPQARVIHSERDEGYSAGAVQVWFARLYGAPGFDGASHRTAGAARSSPRPPRGL